MNIHIVFEFITDPARGTVVKSPLALFHLGYLAQKCNAIMPSSQENYKPMLTGTMRGLTKNVEEGIVSIHIADAGLESHTMIGIQYSLRERIIRIYDDAKSLNFKKPKDDDSESSKKLYESVINERNSLIKHLKTLVEKPRRATMEMKKFCMGDHFKNYEDSFANEFTEKIEISLEHPVIIEMVKTIRADGDYFSRVKKAYKVKDSYLMCYEATQYDGHRNEHFLFWVSAAPAPTDYNRPFCALCGWQESFYANIFRESRKNVDESLSRAKRTSSILYTPGVNGEPDKFEMTPSHEVDQESLICGQCGCSNVVNADHMKSFLNPKNDFMKYIEVPLSTLE